MSAGIVRPNGKVWRGRKPVTVQPFIDYDGSACLVVLGTHDIEEATRLAQHQPEWSESELHLVEPTTDWWRLVPWDVNDMGFDRTWIIDRKRGTPCVVFAP